MKNLLGFTFAALMLAISQPAFADFTQAETDRKEVTISHSGGSSLKTKITFPEEVKIDTAAVDEKRDDARAMLADREALKDSDERELPRKTVGARSGGSAGRHSFAVSQGESEEK